MSAILIRFFYSPAVVLVRLSILMLPIMKYMYTIFQYVGCNLKHQFLKATVLQVTAARAENLPSQCLSKDLGTGCLKLAVVKILASKL